MKFTATAILGLAAAAPFGIEAFQAPAMVPRTNTQLFSTETKTMSKKKEDRLTFMKSEQFHRRGFKEVRDQVESSIQEQYQSPLVDDLKSSNYVIEKDGVKVYLAKVRNVLRIL